jgi:AGZA family xanthine/uracil permease-like MFS transporter
MQAIRRFFQIDEAGSTIGTEIRAGVVTFMTMAYIIVVQPAVLMEAGMPVGGVMLATCIASAVGTLLMALLANYPIALAPAMGHNFYFAFLVTSGQCTWQQALGAVFISGSLFLILSFWGLRERIMRAVPDSLKYGIAVGIGLLIAVVGLRTGGIVVETPSASGWTMAEFSTSTLLVVIGLAMTGGLLALKVRGAILIGLLATAVVGGILGVVHWVDVPVSAPPWSELGQTIFHLDILGALQLGLFGVIFTFFFLDLFDTIGTLIGVTQQAGLMKDGELPRARQALLSDAGGTVVGAALGTSTVTSYIESTAGVSSGGRTGLASVVTAALFLLAIFFSPFVRMIASGEPVQQTYVFDAASEVTVKPAGDAEPQATEVAWAQGGTVTVTRTRFDRNPVTAPTLIIIGCLIMTSVVHIPWGDWTEALPAFLAILVMPLTFSITDGIAFGFIAYTFLKALTRQTRQVSPWVMVFAALFVVRYAYQAMH